MAGVLTAIPYGVAAVGMVVVGRHSDRTGERRWHIAVCAVVGGARVRRVGVRRRRSCRRSSRCRWPCSAWHRCSGRSGRWRRRSMSGVGAAAGIALVNSVGNIGGFVGPNIIGLRPRRDAQLQRRAGVGRRRARGGRPAGAGGEPAREAVRLTEPCSRSAAFASRSESRIRRRVRRHRPLPRSRGRGLTAGDASTAFAMRGPVVAGDDLAVARGVRGQPEDLAEPARSVSASVHQTRRPRVPARHGAAAARNPLRHRRRGRGGRRDRLRDAARCRAGVGRDRLLARRAVLGPRHRHGSARRP